jgi:hypothetical protein
VQRGTKVGEAWTKLLRQCTDNPNDDIDAEKLEDAGKWARPRILPTKYFFSRVVPGRTGAGRPGAGARRGTVSPAVANTHQSKNQTNHGGVRSTASWRLEAVGTYDRLNVYHR